MALSNIDVRMIEHGKEFGCRQKGGTEYNVIRCKTGNHG